MIPPFFLSACFCLGVQGGVSVYKVMDRLLIGLLMLTVIVCGGALIALAWSPYVLESIVFWL